MKYKHIFLIWLFANIILGLTAYFYLFFQSGNNKFNDFEMILIVALYGLFLTLPSLIILSAYYFFYFKKLMYADYKFKLIAIIVIINILYFLASYYFFTMAKEFNYFFLASTLAGLISFAIMDKKVNKNLR